MLYEKRLVARCTQYWETLRKGREIPEYSHFNSGAIDDVKGFLLILQVVPQQGQLFSCRVASVGEHIVEMVGRDLTGDVVTNRGKAASGLQIIHRAAEASKQRTIVMDEGQFVSDKHKIIKYRSCMMPFGKDGNVTHIVAGLSWKEF